MQQQIQMQQIQQMQLQQMQASAAGTDPSQMQPGQMQPGQMQPMSLVPGMMPEGTNLDEVITQFILKWSLDGGAATMLRTASPHLQQVMITNFNPGADSSNISGKFVS